MKRKTAFCFFIVFCICLFAEEAPRVLRAPIWVYLEPVPGIMPAGSEEETGEDSREKLLPIRELDSVARFVMSGMVYGWKFTYTPSDKVRNVEEYFSMEPIQEIPRGDPRFKLTGITPAYPRLNSWAEFTFDEASGYWNKYWNSVLFKNGKGRGVGSRLDETNGIRTAYSQAVLNAVREHARKLEKNKPKEITGEILIKDNPRLYLSGGNFVADINVLINIKEIVPYRVF
ncbi:hypothetical protein K7I13_09045 [Brucepastera parasyntrophica]|uniref:hypothetical protein n=1 Tax=Brucepastera parasyntrophica TaxID=2880008 RepID=UPI00210C1C64|nr:hypothetical protein [Brucepastera parasyntrophica]ULQ58702.1 hypothetical protein K7I13_09045 [Brucepastera parasyntrophica]